MPRPRHTNKEVEAAVSYAEERGWYWRPQGHWGRIYCHHSDRDGCQFGVNGTPKNPEDHAKQVRRAVDRCPHPRVGEQEEADNGDV